MPPFIDPHKFDNLELSSRVTHLKKIYFETMPEVCIERPLLITKYCRNNNLFGKERISVLEKAKMYRYVLENRNAVISHSYGYKSRGAGEKMLRFDIKDPSLFAGSTTGKFKGVPIFPEFVATMIWPELWSISTRDKNPYHLSEEDAKTINKEIFPFWMKDNIHERTRSRLKAEGADLKGMALLQNFVFFMTSKLNCISHTLPDFSRAIYEGLEKVINEAKEKRDAIDDPSQKEFYAAAVEVLKGIIAYSNNLASKAEELAQNERNQDRKQELLDIAEIYRHVPRYPARNFREGLTTVWICWTAIHLENPNSGLSLGRLDQVLYDLYKQDINLSDEDALELICCLWLKIGDHVPMIPETGEQLFGGTGSNQAITIGGVRATSGTEAEDAVNELTYLMLKSTELMMLRDPNLNARYHPDINKPEYLDRICESNLITRATPALHNDKAVIKALESQGVSFEDACDYGIIGCVEPASNGRSYTASASILLNLTSILELTLFNGCHRHTGPDRLISTKTGDLMADPPEIGSFAEFQKAFEEQLLWMADLTTNLNNELGKTHQLRYPTPILSSLFKGPMDKGKDLIEGGAKINASSVTIIGLADVADSLSAIEQVVFKDNKATLSELIDALNKNFEGSDSIRTLHKRLKEAPKYGNDDPLANDNIHWLVTKINDIFQAKTSYREKGKYRVGYWTMTNHAGFGRLMGALPNGRKAKENFTSGITPVSGVTPQLTATLNSVASIPAECVTNGMAFNIKYTPEGDINTELEHFVPYVKTFFEEDKAKKRDGGMEIQFNVTDHDTFLKAVDKPEDYKDLLVRVSGYTAYFKDLNPQMQKEIIERTEYNLSNGTMKEYDNFEIPPPSAGISLGWMKKIPGYRFIVNEVADNILEILLHGMDWAFMFSRGYRRNIENFKGRYVFVTRGGGVDASIVFDNGDVEIFNDQIPEWDVKVIFTNQIALLEFLFSQDQDILNSLLKNEVEIEGNLNYIYRFGYLARDLKNRVTFRSHS